jgi:error-prone DNA polymerase
VVDEPAALLPRMTLGEEVVEDYVSTRLTLRAHPVALLRHILTPGAQKVDVRPTGARAPDLSKISFTRGNPD